MFLTLLDRLLTPDVTPDRRHAEPREAVAVPAELEIDEARHPIEVGNLSAGGLMAHTPVPVPIGSYVTVRIAGHRLTGEVRWQGDGRFGIRFDVALDLDSPIIEQYRPARVETSKVMSRWMV